MKKSVLKVTSFMLAMGIAFTLPVADIAKANTRSIVDNDDRVVPKKVDPRITYISTEWPDGSKTVSTGFLVSRKHVVTSGQSIYDPFRGGKFKSITVIPGKINAEDNNNYGIYKATDESKTPEKWSNFRDPRKNYGVIFLDKEVSNAGDFGFEVRSNYELTEVDRFDGWKKPQFNIQGYSNNSQQLSSKGELTRVFQDTLVYNIDTDESTIGAPIISSTGLVVGINSDTGFNPDGKNSGIRVTDELLSELRSWGVSFQVSRG